MDYLHVIVADDAVIKQRVRYYYDGTEEVVMCTAADDSSGESCAVCKYRRLCISRVGDRYRRVRV